MGRPHSPGVLLNIGEEPPRSQGVERNVVITKVKEE
jgi:hypothetical protein